MCPLENLSSYAWGGRQQSPVDCQARVCDYIRNQRKRWEVGKTEWGENSLGKAWGKLKGQKSKEPCHCQRTDSPGTWKEITVEYVLLRYIHLVQRWNGSVLVGQVHAAWGHCWWCVSGGSPSQVPSLAMVNLQVQTKLLYLLDGGRPWPCSSKAACPLHRKNMKESFSPQEKKEAVSQLSTRHSLLPLPFLTAVRLWHWPSGTIPLVPHFPPVRLQIILPGVCTCCAAEDPGSSCPQNQHRRPWPAGEAAGSGSAPTLPDEGSHLQL